MKWDFQQWRAPLLAAAATAAVFIIAGLILSAGNGWPFSEWPRQNSKTAAPSARVERVPVMVSRTNVARLGIQVVPARSETLFSFVNAVATVAIDESRLSHVHTRVAGWVEQLHVNTTGEYVRAGQPVARIFSQELLSSQAEYLAARRFAASGYATSVVSSGLMRLRVLGMTEGEIRSLQRTGKPMRLVTVTAPASGIVVNRGVSVGTAVDPSTELLTLANMANVWVFAEVPEANMRAIRTGTPASLDFPAAGLAGLPARVQFVYPTLSERTRTLRVRLTVPNRGGLLMPGLYGTAKFEVPLGRGIVVPRDALIDTGRKQHVFVLKGGMFEPRPVSVGARLGNRVLIRQGLAEGELVVASGTFLIDSESRLRATGGGTGHSHGSMASEEGQSQKAGADHAEHENSAQ
jgi:multidrug efflux pump subunit AcrA (membrane-fusion protein)